jgi:hypothetical protein
MRGDEVIGCEVREGITGRSDDRFEPRPTEVKASDDGVEVMVASQAPHVVEDVHDSGVTAAGQHDEAASAHVRDEGLIVEDQRIGLPASVPVGLVGREAPLERGRAVDLAGD